jgi:ATP-binding cassette subfamily B protein
MSESSREPRIIASWEVARLLPRVSLARTIVTPVVVILGGVMSAIFPVATGFVIARIIPAIQSGGLSTAEGRGLINALAVLAGVFVFSQVYGPFQQLIIVSFARRVSLHLRSRVMNATLEPVGIAHLEDPEMLDKVSLSRVHPRAAAPSPVLPVFGARPARPVSRAP